MKKAIIVAIFMTGLFLFVSDFVKSGKLQSFLDENSDKSWADKSQYYLGVMYKISSNYYKAETSFKHLLEKYPESKYVARSMQHIGEIYESTYRKAEAIEIYKNMLEKCTDYENIKLIETRYGLLFNN